MEPTNQTEILEKLNPVEIYVRDLMEDELPVHIYFHSYGHSLVTKTEVLALAEAAKLPPAKMEILAIAALFYNTGYTKDYNHHITESKQLAVKYLSTHGYDVARVDEVLSLLHKPIADVIPATQMEKIFVDAYHSHYGLKKYSARSERLRKEIVANTKEPIELVDWEAQSLANIKKHTFYSQVAIERYTERKKINISKCQRRWKSEYKKAIKRRAKFSISSNKAAEMMFKTSLRNHIDLTAIADNKSNIMLSVNAILLTIGMPLFATYMSDQTFLIVPGIIFMVTCVITMAFATLSTRPVKMDGKSNLDKLQKGTSNLFFFGNFYNLTEPAYQEAIRKIITNDDRLDSSIIKDLFYLGSSLGRKFIYLRMCYNVFISGIILSFIAFLLAYFTN